MSSIVKLLGAVAVAGMVATGGSAFTAAGMSLHPSETTEFIGGQTSQTVLGGTVNNVAYQTIVGQNGRINQIVLTFDGNVEDNSAVTITPSGGSFSLDADRFTCGNVSSNTSTCQPYLGMDPAGTGYYSGMSNLVIVVDGEDTPAP